MSLVSSSKIRFRLLALIILFTLNSSLINSQIIVFERPTTSVQKNAGLFFESETRKLIDLNGNWQVSFNDGLNFSKFIIPMAYDFEGNVIFKRNFNIPEEVISAYSFIFVAEGIEYESEVKINNNFISNHTGGSTPIIVPLSDGILSTGNEIVVNVSNRLDYKNTVPLSDQINYSKVYGGINKDIYIVAVPKLFILKNIVKYTVDNLLTVKLKNTVDIKSSNLFKYIDTSKSKEFFLHTNVLKKSDTSVSVSSGQISFNIGENNSLKITNEISVTNPVIWTPETPELYIVRSIISGPDGKIIDELNSETGFTNLSIKNNQIFQSGKQFRLNGINYYEDQPKFASALDYSVTENDLKNIKTLGFNAIRVPGKSSHPYIVNICNRLGLYLLQEIPFNELSVHYLDNDKYIRLNLNLLAEVLERDNNAPCIFAWGIGNDFDVSKTSSLNYVKSAKALIDSVGSRFKYYTARIFTEDICSEEVDFVGINFYGNNIENIKNSVNEALDKTKSSAGRKNPNIFVSSFGLNIQNNNSKGFSDIQSQEAQMKFISEGYTRFSQSMFGSFISSYADWNSSNPLNYPMDSNSFLKTNGIYTFNREQKRSADFIKRIMYKEDLPRIQEGNTVKDFPYIFIIVGLIVIVIFVYFINRDKKFRSSVIRCLYKPTYFYTLVKDQMIITTGYNLLLSFSISIGIALFFSSLIYFYRDNNSLDMILAKIFTNDTTKESVSGIINNKFYLFSLITLINILLTFFTAVFLFIISFYTKGKSYFKNIYTICVWSTLPMILFLFFGTVFYKLAESNPAFISFGVWTFIILYFLYLNRIFLGTKSLFDIRTGKVYLYGFIIIFIIFAVIYSYFLFFTGAIETIDLVSVLTN